MHPFIKILVFVFILLCMQFLSDALLWALCLFVCLVAAKLQKKEFLRMVKRLRWLFFSILIIYAYGTPGEYIQQIPDSFAPTIEGVYAGILQIAKLLIALAMLNILFATSSKAQLMTGLSILLSPLNIIGFNAMRFTARLMLTLDYVEEMATNDTFKMTFKQLSSLHLVIDSQHSEIQPTDGPHSESLRDEKWIELQNPPFNLIDKVLIAIFSLSALVYGYLTVML